MGARWFGWVRWAALGLLLLLFAYVDVRVVRLLTRQPAGVDFLPIWTALRSDPWRLYDFAYISARQSWLYGGKIRPFVYPPTALVVLAPLGWARFAVSYIALTVASAGAYLAVARRLGADLRLLAPLPLTILVAIAGQVTFLVGALVAGALALRSRPLLAGLLFGLAGAVKPQALVFLPLALLIQRNWRAFVATGVTITLLAALSLLTDSSWIDWAHALVRFQDLIATTHGDVADAVTPFTMWGSAATIAAIPIALAGVVLAFRTDDVAVQLLALIGGALLISPYAMNYDFALVAPAILALISRRSASSPLTWPALALLVLAVFHGVGFLALIAAVALVFIDAWVGRGAASPVVGEAV